MKNSKQDAFTLVELLISITLIIILLGVMIPAVTAVKNAGKKTMAEAEAAAIQNAIKSYQTRYGMYPVKDPNNLHYYSKTGDEVLDAEDGWALLENIADKNDDGVFLLELENYREGNNGEVLDPFRNPYVFLMDMHNDNSEYMADGKIELSNNSFDGDDGNEYQIEDLTDISGGLKVIFYTGNDMKEIDDE